MSERFDTLVYTVQRFVRATEKAVLLVIDDGSDEGGAVEDWFPKSQINYTEGDTEISLPRWLAIEKGLGKPVREDTTQGGFCDDDSD